MSRSRNYQRSRRCNWDSLSLDKAPDINEMDGINEYYDHYVHYYGWDYDSDRARVMLLIDAKSRHHRRPRNRTGLRSAIIPQCRYSLCLNSGVNQLAIHGIIRRYCDVHVLIWR